MSQGRESVLAEPYAIEMLNITKVFPGIIANDNITLQLKKGEIHALLGENGAGKSTLMSVLFGMYQPEEGVIKKDGKEVKINDPNDANDLGIGMVHQHFKLVRRRADHEGWLPAQGRGPQEGARALGEIRPAGRSGRDHRGHHRRHAAAHRDSQDALPRQRDPHLRRADGGAHAAGDRRADEDHEEPRRRGQEHPLHLPQALGDHGGGGSLLRAAQGQVHRHRGDEELLPGGAVRHDARRCPP